jgi:hypothetical protein
MNEGTHWGLCVMSIEKAAPIRAKGIAAMIEIG